MKLEPVQIPALQAKFNSNTSITSKVKLVQISGLQVKSIQIEGLQVNLVQTPRSQVKLMKICKCWIENRLKLSLYISGNTLSNPLVNVEGTFVEIKKRDAIFASIPSRLKKSIHKYGIEVPTTIKHARAVNKIHASSTRLYNLVLATSINNKSKTQVSIVSVQYIMEKYQT